MICVICRQAELVGGSTMIVLERGEFRLLVSNVPAHICLNCSEAYVEKAIAERLLQIAEQMFEEGLLNTQCEYSTR